jgi:hypothetical protein
VKPLPDEFAAITRAAHGNSVWTKPTDYLIPNRRQARNAERSPKVMYSIVKRVAALRPLLNAPGRGGNGALRGPKRGPASRLR